MACWQRSQLAGVRVVRLEIITPVRNEPVWAKFKDAHVRVSDQYAFGFDVFLATFAEEPAIAHRRQ